MKKITLCWLVIFIGIISSVQAQYVYDFKHTADIYYNSRDYYSAAQYYNKALGTFKIKSEQVRPYNIAGSAAAPPSGKLKDYQLVVARLAESYRLFYDYGNAETWYSQLVGFNNPAFPQARYWYAICLRFNGKYQEAMDEFNKFKQSYTVADELSVRTPLEIASCEFALSEANKEPRYTIVKTSGNVNEGGANYAPVILDGGTLMYTSSRPENPPLPVPLKQPVNKKPAKKGTPYVNDLYTASGNDNTFDNSQKVKIPTAKGYDQGVSALTPDGNSLYLTRWSVKEGTKQSAIYLSTRQNGVWSEPKILGDNVNVAGYSSMQPYITADGKYLLFASNRPGGMGKNDLWYCIMTNGTPGSARNMGTAINTKDEEQAPFYDAEKNLLVFSTDGRVGLGGLDFFQSEGDFGTWSTPVNMGRPLNSAKDDIYYAALDNTHPFAAGFISSDRESICCLEVFGISRIKKVASGLIIDCDTQLPLQGATITLLDTVRRKTIKKITLDATGRYTFEVDPQRFYKIVAEKDNYFTKAIYFNTDTLARVDSMNNPTLCLKHYEIEKPIVLNNIYYDFGKATLRDDSKLVLDTVVDMLKDNPKITIEMSAHTDSVGSVKFNDKLSQDRAQSCVDYLISKGISPDRLIAKGYGKSKPIAPNSLPDHKDNPEGRQLNRRTEFKVLRRQVQVKTEDDSSGGQ